MSAKLCREDLVKTSSTSRFRNSSHRKNVRFHSLKKGQLQLKKEVFDINFFCPIIIHIYFSSKIVRFLRITTFLKFVRQLVFEKKGLEPNKALENALCRERKEAPAKMRKANLDELLDKSCWRRAIFSEICRSEFDNGSSGETGHSETDNRF